MSAKKKIPWADSYRFDDEDALPIKRIVPDPKMARLTAWLYSCGFRPAEALFAYVRLTVINPHALAAEAQRLLYELRTSFGLKIEPPIRVAGRFEFIGAAQRSLQTPPYSVSEIRLLGVDDSMIPELPAPNPIDVKWIVNAQPARGR